ncbi:MAG TPA: hypothetical protein VFF74_10795 [Methylophilaceae bacterium]|nr:hypothetical protein [Methylophilaceae bacterium]
MKTFLTTLFASLALLAACSPDPHQAPELATSQRQALDQAKDVSATLQQSADQAKQQAEEQSQ